jgi:hypothetical protein
MKFGKKMSPGGQVETATAPPRTSEYLPEAIQQAVMTKGLKHPLTVYPLALGAAAGIVGYLFAMPAFYLLALGGLLSGPAWAISKIFLMNEKTANQYLRSLNQRQKNYERGLRRQIDHDLKECERLKGLRNYARQGLEQFNRIKTKLDNVTELLRMKLSDHEMTFNRFLGAAEQVNLSVLNNLKDLVSRLKSAGTIDVDYIQNRLLDIDAKPEPTQADLEQQETLHSRLELRREQIEQTESLLTQNEKALTEMEKISAAIAQWQTDGRFTQIDFETAITRLQELAAQAHEYNP